MKNFFTALMIFTAFSLSSAQTTSSVTFSVNMGVAAANGKLNVATDNVYLSGSMNGWNATSIPMTRTSSVIDTIYTVTLSDMIVDSSYHYKFVAGSNWELLDGDDNIHRIYKVKANPADNILPLVYWSNDSTYSLYPAKPIKITFKCNMDFEIAKGYFDPAIDILNVRGGFNGWTNLSNIMKKQLTGSIFKIDTTLTMAVGDSQAYKFAYTHLGNTTWETDNQLFGLSQEDYIAGEILVDRYFDDGDKFNSQTGFDLYFQVDCKAARGSFSTGPTDFPNGIKNVIVCGSQRPLIWPALGWPDATFSDLIKLKDDGLDGDLAAGDAVYTAKVTFPAYSSLRFEYKYGINYGLPDDNAGGNDNEAFGGGNHLINIGDNTITSIRTNDIFGKTGPVVLTGVQDKNQTALNYSLSQNYPNPFNPSTNFEFQVPNQGFVTLKVFNILGNEVASLVNENKPAGQYKIHFDGSNLSSGIYFYQLKTGQFTQSRKMILIK